MVESHIYLLEDTMVEILLRLPIKSLVRFRCVCKSWYHYIGSTSFINFQINTVPNTKNQYLLCEYGYFYTLMCEEELSDERKYCYMPELFGMDRKLNSSPVRVHGSCKGLLCVSDKLLYFNSIIYLWNPIIRKSKRIPKIPVEDHEQGGDASLCLGYFNEDYKVIRISPFHGNYRVGVYSLTTDSWKITYCDSKDGTFNSWHIYPSSRCVSGVAYFAKYKGRIVCFDLHDERIREVKLPENFDLSSNNNQNHSFFMEAWGESIGFIEVKKGILAQWTLRNCGVTNSSSWEKTLTVDLNAVPPCYPMGFTYTGKYVLRNSAHFNEFYLCDLETSELHDFTICAEKGECMYAIDYLVGNLALLNEETIDPFQDMDRACFTRTRFILHKRRRPRKKKNIEILHKAQNKLQGRRTKRKIGDT